MGKEGIDREAVTFFFAVSSELGSSARHGRDAGEHARARGK